MQQPGCIKRFFLRLSHRRGHSIHSPFVYGLVRNVFVGRPPMDETLYNELMARRMNPRHARQIGRIYRYLRPEGFAFDPQAAISGCFSVYMPGVTLPDRVEEGAIICLPCLKRNREIFAAELARDRALSIDRGGYALFFYNSALPRQYFIL